MPRRPLLVALVSITIVIAGTYWLVGARTPTGPIRTEVILSPREPWRDEEARIAVRLTHPVTGAPVRRARVTAVGDMVGCLMAPPTVTLSERDAGWYDGTMRFTMEGTWDVRVVVSRDQRYDFKRFRTEVRPPGEASDQNPGNYVVVMAMDKIREENRLATALWWQGGIGLGILTIVIARVLMKK